ncbi:monocarboxylate transporter 12-like [Patella vulgata]|uniref:monocarboxylate transporter 12-like n=1 Tax=Patella vulgata TaxID=6465 RepID=UPI00217FF968|nr:monocarboxylate transporter 12-like [Patella vulgata]
MGSLVFPYFVQYLLNTFALRGTLLIMGGVQCQMFAFALLLREPESFALECRRKNKNTNNRLSEITNPRVNIEMKLLRSISNDLKMPQTMRPRTQSESDKNAVYERHLSRLESDSNQSFLDSLSQSRILKYLSNTDLMSLSAADASTETIEEVISNDKSQTDTHKSCKCRYLCKLSNILDLSLLKNYVFILLMIISALAIGMFLGPVYIPALMIENGANEKDTALFLTVVGVSDVASRLFVGAIADLRFIKRHHIMMTSLLLGGITSQFTDYYTTFELQMVFSLIFGMSLGPYAALLPVVLTDFLGLQNLGKSMGFLFCVHGAFIAAYHPLVGEFLNKYNFLY